MADFLQIKNYSCGYERGFHVSDISISVSKGSFNGIIGPNGCGKTTLFRGISGELPKKTGVLEFEGKSLSSLDFNSKAKIFSVVAQQNEMPRVTVNDYVLMGRLPYRKPYQFFDSAKDQEIAKHYMDLTGVGKLHDKWVDSLSGGEKQMVAITRALVQEPKLLLLDEPTAHLDIKHQVEILNLVQQLNEKMGLTVLMIIHDLNLAGEYCDNLVMMKNGNIMYQGKPTEVLDFQKIEDVYETVVVTKLNPVSKRPAIFLVSERVLKNG